MVPHWGYEAPFSIWLLWLFLSSGVCLGDEIKGSMYSSHLCKSNGNKVFWLSEKTTAIITGKSDDRARKHCKIVFGLASNNGNARLRLNFDAMYFHDCGVRLQINQSTSSKFDKPDTNKEIFFSGCYGGNPGPLYAQPRNYVLLSLTKKDIKLQAFNFRLNISVAEKLPTTGPPLHVVIIVSFVCTVVVITAAVLLLKYVVRISYRWSEERREQAMTRAINIYNSCEPSEEPEMVYIRPGPGGSASSSSHSGSAGQGSGRSKQTGAEIAFVHSDGRIERFRPLAHQRQEQTSSAAPLQRPKPQKCRVKTSPSAGPRQPSRAKNATADTSDEPVHFLVRYSHNHNNESQSLIDLSETASLGGTVLPPSYEEALDMPQPEAGGTSQSADNLSGAVAAVGHPDSSNPCDPCPSIQINTSSEERAASGRNGKDLSKRPSEDLEEPGPDSANYVNIGGRLEILGTEFGEEDDESKEQASQRPLLQPPK